MLSLAIGAQRDTEKLCYRITSELNALTADGVRVIIEEKSKGGIIFLNCQMTIDKKEATLPIDELQSLFKHYVSNALAEHVLAEYEKRLITKIVKETFDCFTKEEQKEVVEYTHNLLSDNSQEYKRNYIYKLNRKSKILYQLLEYLEDQEEVVVEGFINFRLKDYIEDLRDAVNKAVDEYLMEKEYQEFIRLLKYFVDVQEPRIKKVHVVIKGAGVFKLLDQQKQVINNEYLEDFILDIADSEINYDDLLISALITIAPGDIVLHCSTTNKSTDVVETILGVFAGRVKLCHDCELCKTEQLQQLNLTPQHH